MRWVAVALLAVLLLAACTIERQESAAEVAVDTTIGDAAQERVDTDADVLPPEESGPESTPGDPVIRTPENLGQVESTSWLARTAMDATSVELVWSPVDGAETYRLYRIPTALADYDAIAVGEFSGAEEVFNGDQYGFIDIDPPTGTFLTYFVVAELDDRQTEARWTEALTVDDVTPPTPVTELTASITA